MSIISLVKYGWSSYDVVKMEREWCEICAKSRWHEELANHKVCLACTNTFYSPPKSLPESYQE